MIESTEMFLTTDRLECRLRELEQFRFVQLTSISPVSAMPGNLNADEVYRNVPQHIEGGQLAVGDEFAGRDHYLWVQKSVKLPGHAAGYELYGLFDFGRTGSGNNSGFESLLYINGEPYQGLDTNHQDVNLEPFAGQMVELTILLWTGLEGGGAKREFRHRINRMDIGYLHLATDELYYLAKAMVKTVRILDANDTDRYILTQILERSLDCVDWDKDHVHSTAGNALETLKAELAQTQKHSEIIVNAVGHTHIDVAWLWRLKHTREKAIRSFSTALRLMDEFDDFIFLQTQPQLYQYIRQDCPLLYEKIKARVAQGRWEVDGGMWLEADCNLSSGEALVRQLLYGIRFIHEEFGHTCKYLWLPDVFGYSWALPQILKGVGIETFMTTKISWNQYNSMPHDLFKWRGIDGSEVMTYFITTPEVGQTEDNRFSTYNGMLSPRSVLGCWKKFRDKNLSCETLVSYGYGDGGGGVNRNMLKMRRAMDSLPGLPHVKTDRASNFFDRMQRNLDHTDQYVPVWDGELYLEYHRGTYTSQAWNKWMNRRMEFALTECEWLSTLSMLAGGRYDQAALLECWQTVLRNQFHDIIPGSSITEVYEDCRTEYAITEETVKALNAEALKILAKPQENTWALWHFGSFPRRDEVFIEEHRQGCFVDSSGRQLRSQRVENGYYVEVNLLALSAAALCFKETGCEVTSPFQIDLEHRQIETPFYIIQWDTCGNLSRLYDLENSREVLLCGAKANVLEIYEDKPINHDNWDIDIFHMRKKENPVLVSEPGLVTQGPVRAALRFCYLYRNSTIQQEMVLHASNRRIDFETKVSWHEDHRLLKAAFPVDIRNTKAFFDIQYGHVERPTHYNTSWDYARFEVVAHKWIDLSEDGYGVSILNDCKYGHSVHNNVMRITLLKSGKYPDPQADMGDHVFTYALFPHAGSVTEGDTIEEAVKLNLPPQIAKGIFWETEPLFRTESRNIIIDTVKKAEDDNCLIVRMHECKGGRTTVELQPYFGIMQWAQCNLLEEVAGDIRKEPSIKTQLRPFEIKTIKVWPVITK